VGVGDTLSLTNPDSKTLLDLAAKQILEDGGLQLAARISKSRFLQGYR
jgi:hypothetical protein